jgi:predicted ATPase
MPPCHCWPVGVEPDAQLTAAATAAGSGLLERADHLAILRDALDVTLRTRTGVLVLLSGEAGGGKTTLLRGFCGGCEPVEHILWGACDPLFTPRPLGPFVDIADELGGGFRDLVAAGAKPHQVAAALVDQARAARGTVVVLEDLHWADEATLDVLSLLGRRISGIPALVIATYRDDELDRTHPLRRFVGELRSSNSIRRLKAQPLSLAAVRSLAEPCGLDAQALHRPRPETRSSSPRCSPRRATRSRRPSATRCWPGPPG